MKRYLNLGCGDRFLPSWTNVDLIPSAPGIIKHNLYRSLPFTDNGFDAVYLSHVLEHFDQDAGLSLLKECYRVCIPGGVLRAVVPDLETIVRLYLKYLEDASVGNENATPRYHWMTLELFDQMVRTQTGGGTASFVRQSPLELSAFLRSRIGSGQYATLRQTASHREKIVSRLARLSAQPSRLWTYSRGALTQFLMLLLWGRSGLKISNEVLFRSRGEIHRWMYDRFSLPNALMQAGFKHPVICSPYESQIENWKNFNLDVDLDNSIHKPDSLFCEGIKA
jgi:predicted SAM-dependent methyltransferase